MTRPFPPQNFFLHAALRRAQTLAREAREAAKNLLGILRHEPSRAVQLVSGLWPAIWGLNALYAGNALFVSAPLLYAWMHTGFLSFASARLWGTLFLVVGLWQGYALSWPMPDREAACRRAVKVLCGLNAALTTGFFLSMPAAPSWKFYCLGMAVSAWCLYRLTPKKATQVLTSEGLAETADTRTDA